MRCVGWAFAWEVWGRHRLMMLLALAYLLALILLFQVAPAGTFEAPIDRPNTPPLGFALSLPLGFALVYLLAAFAHGDQAQLESRESGYPRRAFTLPVRTAALAGWPLALGASVTVLLWLAVAGLVWRPCGLAVPLLWPAAFFAAFLTWLQAFVWWPFPFPFVRIIAATVVLGALGAAALLGRAYAVPEPVLLAASAGLIVTGHALAVAGVARARRGDGTTGDRVTPTARSVERPLPLFAAPSRALFWMAWRRGGFLLPLSAGLVWLAHLALVCSTAEAPAIRVVVTAQLIWPLLMASSIGGTLAARGLAVPHDSRLSPFVASRPVPTALLVGVLLRVAFASALLTWAVVLLPLFAELPFIPAGTVLAADFERLVASQGAKAWVLLALGVVALPALTWRQMVSGFWSTLAGRKWLGATLAIATAAGYTGLAVSASLIFTNPEATAALLVAVPWLLAAALALKLLGGGVVVWALHRRRLVEARTLARLGIAWGAAAVGIVALALWLVPPALASPWTVAGWAVLLLLPLVRLGLAPLVLDWNRHR